MDYPGCKGFVDDLISEASAEFSPAYTLRKNAQERLDKVCELVDALAEELDCESVDVSVNTSSKQLTIMVLCDDIIWRTEHIRSLNSSRCWTRLHSPSVRSFCELS